MPQYHNYEKTRMYGKIIVTPYPFWRRIFRFFPYYVGDRISFRVKLEKMDGYLPSKVFERFGDSVKIVQNFSSKELNQEIVGNPINGEGDIEYIIGEKYNSEYRLTILTTNVINKDRWFHASLGLIIGAILAWIGVILAWILGFLKIIWK